MKPIKKRWTAPKIEVTLIKAAQADTSGTFADGVTGRHKLTS